MCLFWKRKAAQGLLLFNEGINSGLSDGEPLVNRILYQMLKIKLRKA
jgi:hypothetical protein